MYRHERHDTGNQKFESPQFDKKCGSDTSDAKMSMRPSGGHVETREPTERVAYSVVVKVAVHTVPHCKEAESHSMLRQDNEIEVKY
jgi:hypothetical protein